MSAAGCSRSASICPLIWVNFEPRATRQHSSSKIQSGLLFFFPVEVVLWTGCCTHAGEAGSQKDLGASIAPCPQVTMIFILHFCGISENIICFHFAEFSVLGCLRAHNKWSHKRCIEIPLATSGLKRGGSQQHASARNNWLSKAARTAVRINTHTPTMGTTGLCVMKGFQEHRFASCPDCI